MPHKEHLRKARTNQTLTNATNFRIVQMKKLRELKTKQDALIEKMKTSSDKAIEKQADLAKEMLSAHLQATRDMHRGYMGFKKKK
ncbi:MAG: hypothetical protein AABW59_00435 [archaeon]